MIQCGECNQRKPLNKKSVLVFKECVQTNENVTPCGTLESGPFVGAILAREKHVHFFTHKLKPKDSWWVLKDTSTAQAVPSAELI